MEINGYSTSMETKLRVPNKGKRWTQLEKGLSATPIVGIFSNIVTLALKAKYKNLADGKRKSNHFYRYLDQKSKTECFLSMIPGVGLVYRFSRHNSHWRNKELLNACKKQKEAKKITKLIDDGANINAKCSKGSNFLIYALKEKNYAAAEIFAKNENLDVNATNNWGNIALIYAVIKGQNAAKVTSELLKKENIDVNKQGYKNRTALMYAIDFNPAAAEALLEREDIDLMLFDFVGKNAFMYARKAGNIELAKKIAKHKNFDVNQADRSGKTPLMYALQDNNREIASIIVCREDFDVNKKDKLGMTPLMHALKEKQTEIAKLLIEKETIDINIADNEGKTALMHAIMNGQTEISIDLASNKDLLVNKKDHLMKSALFYALLYSNEEVAEVLVNRVDLRIDTEQSYIRSPTPLRKKSRLYYTQPKRSGGGTATDNYELLNKIMDGNNSYVKSELWQYRSIKYPSSIYSCNFSLKNNYAKQVLLASLSVHNDHVTNLLLDRFGAEYLDINTRLSTGENALMFAVMNGNTQAAFKILTLDSSDKYTKLILEATDKQGRTALMIAIQYGNVEIAKKILQIGVDVNHTDNSGKTAYSYALEYNFLRILKLIESNENFKMPSKFLGSQTSFMLAVEKGYDKIAKKLIRKPGFNFLDHFPENASKGLKEKIALIIAKTPEAFSSNDLFDFLNICSKQGLLSDEIINTLYQNNLLNQEIYESNKTIAKFSPDPEPSAPPAAAVVVDFCDEPPAPSDDESEQPSATENESVV